MAVALMGAKTRPNPAPARTILGTMPVRISPRKPTTPRSQSQRGERPQWRCPERVFFFFFLPVLVQRVAREPGLDLAEPALLAEERLVGVRVVAGGLVVPVREPAAGRVHRLRHRDERPRPLRAPVARERQARVEAGRAHRHVARLPVRDVPDVVHVQEVVAGHDAADGGPEVLQVPGAVEAEERAAGLELPQPVGAPLGEEHPAGLGGHGAVRGARHGEAHRGGAADRDRLGPHRERGAAAVPDGAGGRARARVARRLGVHVEVVAGGGGGGPRHSNTGDGFVLFFTGPSTYCCTITAVVMSPGMVLLHRDKLW